MKKPRKLPNCLLHLLHLPSPLPFIPSSAVAELMRLLIDVHGLSYEDAWTVTTKTVAYTNHT